MKSAKNALIEMIEYNSIWKIRRFLNEFEHSRNNPYDISIFKKNLLLNEGINELWTILCSAGGTKWDNSNAYLGVGNSSSAANAVQTGLQGASTDYQPMDTGFPTFGTDQKATWVATFGSGDANFDWEEFTVVNGADGDQGGADINLNRKVENEGTKVLGQVWELTLEITLS